MFRRRSFCDADDEEFEDDSPSGLLGPVGLADFADSAATAEWFASLFESGRVQTWILASKQRTEPIAQIHKSSYEKFVELLIEIVQENDVVRSTNYQTMREVEIRFRHPKLGPPVLCEPTGAMHECLPNECRHRGEFYSAPLRVDACL